MEIEDICFILNIKGLVHYSETEKYIFVNGYLYIRDTGRIIDANGKVVYPL